MVVCMHLALRSEKRIHFSLYMLLGIVTLFSVGFSTIVWARRESYGFSVAGFLVEERGIEALGVISAPDHSDRARYTAFCVSKTMPAWPSNMRPFEMRYRSSGKIGASRRICSLHGVAYSTLSSLLAGNVEEPNRGGGEVEATASLVVANVSPSISGKQTFNCFFSDTVSFGSSQIDDTFQSWSSESLGTSLEVTCDWNNTLLLYRPIGNRIAICWRIQRCKLPRNHGSLWCSP